MALSVLVGGVILACGVGLGAGWALYWLIQHDTREDRKDRLRDDNEGWK